MITTNQAKCFLHLYCIQWSILKCQLPCSLNTNRYHWYQCYLLHTLERAGDMRWQMLVRPIWHKNYLIYIILVYRAPVRYQGQLQEIYEHTETSLPGRVIGPLWREEEACYPKEIESFVQDNPNSRARDQSCLLSLYPLFQPPRYRLSKIRTMLRRPTEIRRPYIKV